MSGPVSTEMGDRVWVQFPVWDIYLGVFPRVASHPGQLSLAVPLRVGAMSTSQKVVMPGMVRVWVAGKTM